MKSYRLHAIEILEKFYTSTDTLKSILTKYFSQNKVDQSIRNRTSVLVKEIIRWKGRIDWYISRHLNSPFNKLQSKLLAAMEIGVYEILLDEKVPTYAAISSIVEIIKKTKNRKASGLVNAILRKVSKDAISEKPNDVSDADWCSVQNWMFNKWVDEYGKEQAQQLSEYFLREPQLTIRRNRAIKSADFEQSISEDIKLFKRKDSDIFYNIEEGGGKLRNSNLFSNGAFSFQDRASGMIVEVLDPKPGDLVLDVCCAPGTKTNYIAEYIKDDGKIYASDIDENRIELVKNDSNRLNHTCIEFSVKDATKDEYIVADKILIDAPCTGTGTIGRRPDIKWRRKSKHLDSVIKIQRLILDNVSKFLKPGGELVYATCSLEDEENWQVVDAFLKFHNDFKVLPVQNPKLVDYIDEKGALSTFPPTHKMDGMFAVKLKRDEK